MSVASAAKQRLAAVDAMPEPERLGLILATLEDEAPTVREQAIRYAARYLEPARLVHLVANHERALLRNSAIAALERQGPYAVAPLVDVLTGSADAELAMFTLQVLTRIGDPSSAGAVLPFVRHEDLNVAQAAIEALGAFRAADAVPHLLALMAGNLWLQLAAVNALGEIGDARATGPLLALVPDSLVAIPAIQALARLPASAVAEPLAQLLCDLREPASREAVLIALADVIARDPAQVSLAPALAVVDGASDEPTLTRMLSEATRAGTTSPAARRSAALLSAAVPMPALWPAALLALHELGDTTVVPALLQAQRRRLRAQVDTCLLHQNPLVRAILLEHAAPDAVTSVRLMQALQDVDTGVRTAACRALASRHCGEAVPRLVELLKTGSDAERDAAASALAHLESDTLAPLAACLVASAEPELIIQALGVLEQTGGQPQIERVIELAAHASPSVRRAALRVLAGLPDRRVDPVLLKALGDVHPAVPAEALEMLVQRGGDRALNSLIGLLSLADSLRFRVIRALGRLRVARAATKLESLYPSCALHEQLEIIGALVLIGGPGVRAFLHARFAEPELEARRAAARGLAALAGTGDLPQLRTMAEDRDWNVRNEAARGLARLPLDDTRPLLLTLARDIESVVSATAREALGGTSARERTAQA